MVSCLVYFASFSINYFRLFKCLLLCFEIEWPFFANLSMIFVNGLFLWSWRLICINPSVEYKTSLIERNLVFIYMPLLPILFRISFLNSAGQQKNNWRYSYSWLLLGINYLIFMHILTFKYIFLIVIITLSGMISRRRSYL